MKIRVGFAVFVILAVAAKVFSFDTAKWEYKAPIITDTNSKQYCKLEITPPVYDHAASDFADLRIIDAAGGQVPYVYSQPMDTAEKLQYQPAIINKTTLENKTSLITLDFGQKIVKNSIDVITAGGNFRRLVTVEGSNDNIAFFTLVSQAYVFAVNSRHRFSTVELPSNDYRYLRIAIEKMPSETDCPVIEQVVTCKIGKVAAARRDIAMTLISSSEDANNHTSSYVYDLAHRHLPLSEITLDVGDPAFYRYVTIEGRDESKIRIPVESEDARRLFREVEASWNMIVSDAVYRYAGANRGQKLTLYIPPYARAYRYLKVTISNYDDKALTLNSATAAILPHQLVFPSQASGPLWLYFCCPDAPRPRYDLAQRLTDAEKKSAISAKLGDVVANPLFKKSLQKAVPWTEQHKSLLLIAMLVVAAVLAAFILKSFKSIQSQQQMKD